MIDAAITCKVFKTNLGLIATASLKCSQCLCWIQDCRFSPPIFMACLSTNSG